MDIEGTEVAESSGKRKNDKKKRPIICGFGEFDRIQHTRNTLGSSKIIRRVSTTVLFQRVYVRAVRKICPIVLRLKGDNS